MFREHLLRRAAECARRQGQRGGRRQSGAVGVRGRVLGVQQLTLSGRDVGDRSDTVPICCERPLTSRGCGEQCILLRKAGH